MRDIAQLLLTESMLFYIMINSANFKVKAAFFFLNLGYLLISDHLANEKREKRELRRQANTRLGERQ